MPPPFEQFSTEKALKLVQGNMAFTGDFADWVAHEISTGDAKIYVADLAPIKMRKKVGPFKFNTRLRFMFTPYGSARLRFFRPTSRAIRQTVVAVSPTSDRRRKINYYSAPLFFSFCRQNAYFRSHFDRVAFSREWPLEVKRPAHLARFRLCAVFVYAWAMNLRDAILALVFSILGGLVVLIVEQLTAGYRERRRASRLRRITDSNADKVITDDIFQSLGPSNSVALMREMLGVPNKVRRQDCAIFSDRLVETISFLYLFKNAMVKVTSKDNETIDTLTVIAFDDSLSVGGLLYPCETNQLKFGKVKVCQELLDDSDVTFIQTNMDASFAIYCTNPAPVYLSYTYFGFAENGRDYHETNSLPRAFFFFCSKWPLNLPFRQRSLESNRALVWAQPPSVPQHHSRGPWPSVSIHSPDPDCRRRLRQSARHWLCRVPSEGQFRLRE